MEPIIATLATAAGLFAGTNIDDMVVLAVLNASRSADGRPKAWQIWTGQASGIALLVLISLLAGLGLRLLPEGWIWLLGLVPISFGVRKLIIAIRAHTTGTPVSAAVATGLPGVVGLTVANGGDNIAAYTPVFRTISPTATALTIAVFAAGVPLWCLVGSWLVGHHRITNIIRRWGRPRRVHRHRLLRLPQGWRPRNLTPRPRPGARVRVTSRKVAELHGVTWPGISAVALAGRASRYRVLAASDRLSPAEDQAEQHSGTGSCSALLRGAAAQKEDAVA